MLNVKFNILNKQIYNIFPFPWCVVEEVERLGVSRGADALPGSFPAST
jgi:hypothetical protein